MDSTRTVVSAVFVWAITFLVPGLVWSLLAAGLYQLIRDAIRRVRLSVQRKQPLAHESAG